MSDRTQDEIDLYDAVTNGDIARVKELLTKGVNPNITDDRGDYLLIEAINRQNLEIVEILINHKEIDLSAANDNFGRYSALHTAVVTGDIFVELLLAKEVNINAKTVAGDTPLYFAADFNVKRSVEILLDAGADKTIKNNLGETAEDLSRDNECYEIADYIRDYQYEPDIKEPECDQ